jgi:hypothetical protein
MGDDILTVCAQCDHGIGTVLARPDSNSIERCLLALPSAASTAMAITMQNIFA